MKLTSKLFLLYLGTIFVVCFVRANPTSTNNGSNTTNVSSSNGVTETPDKSTDPDSTAQTTSKNNNTISSTVPAVAPTTQAPGDSNPTSSEKSGSGTSPGNSPNTASSTTTVAQTSINSTKAPITSKSPSSSSSSSSAATTKAATTIAATTIAVSTSPVSPNDVVTTPKATTTLAPTTTNDSVTTETKPVTTEGPPATTQSPGETTTNNGTEAASSTPVPSSTKENDGSGTTPSNTTASPLITSSASPPVVERHMYINEIMLNKQGGFQTIELNVTNPVDLTHFTMVMVDGGTNKTMVIQNFTDMQQKNGLVMVALSNNTDAMMKTKGIGIAIYNIDQVSTVFRDDWTVNSAGLVDALVIGSSYEQISTHLVETLTPGMNPFVLDPSLYGMDRTISRCSFKMTCNTDMYALVNPSLGSDNSDKCRERLNYHETLAIKFVANCNTMLNSSSKREEERIMHYIIREVNRKCHCGITRMHVKDPQVQCCGSTSLDMNFVAPNENQKETFLNYYKAFIHSTTNVDVDGHNYKIDNSCYSNCCATPIPATGDDKKKNTKVTVAVVVTCMLIFLVILILVLLYMRKKKTAVYQFRMSRLEEEDDYPMGAGDQDEFVGGQEATFDIKA